MAELVPVVSGLSAVSPGALRALGGLCKGDGFGEKGWELPPEAGCVVGQGEQEEWPGWDAAGTVVQRQLVCSLLSLQSLQGALKLSVTRMRPQTCRTGDILL